MTIKQTIKLSAIIDKLELKITDPKAGQEAVGADLIIQLAAKAHKAEKEIYNFIADFKKITAAEAEDVEISDFAKELFNIPGLSDFFKSAVKLSAQG